MKDIPKHLEKLLWEYDTQELNKTSPIVIERVLSLGDLGDIEYIGLASLRNYFIEKKPLLDSKSNNFWSIICNIPRSSSPTSYELLNTPVFYRNFR